MKYTILTVLLFGFWSQSPAQTAGNGALATVSGTVKDASNGESLFNAAVVVEAGGKKYSVLTNTYGYFSLTAVQGPVAITVTSLGYIQQSGKYTLAKSNSLVFKLKPSVVDLDEVTVGVERGVNTLKTTEISVAQISAKEVKKLPQLLGEADVIRAIRLLPGVSSVGEGANGFNVRGGNSDQNLILLDEAPVFNSSHLFGFFSIFNADAVRDAKLYKGGMPSIYGGRLSSVLDVRQREGNNQRWASSGGVGLLSSRLLVEGPLVKDKASVMLAGRRSYFDVFLPLFNNPELAQTILYFYDFNGKINAQLSKKDRVYASFYNGRDRFGADDLFQFGWGNWTATTRWNRAINDKLFFNATALYSDYTYLLGTPNNAETQFQLNARIQNYVTTAAWSYFPSTKHSLDFGVQNTYYVFSPGKITGAVNLSLNQEWATEPSAYISHTWKATPLFSVTSGLRYSAFGNLGPRTLTLYKPGGIYEDSTAIGTRTYEKGESIRWFTGLAGLEPRMSANLELSENASLKASYNRNRQYIHLISNNTSPTPVNVWRPAGAYIEPATAQQVALGFVQKLARGAGMLTIETYYKGLQNIVDYKDGADLIFKDNIETELLRGKGRAYGLEFMLEKKTGKFNGWISYTLSRTELQVDGPTRGLSVNNGAWYLANYNKLHDLNLVANYAPNKQWDLSGTWSYQSGRPITYPDSRGEFEGIPYPIYANRNGGLTPATHRLDLAATFAFKGKGNRKPTLAFGVYNAYARRNPYSVFFRQDFNTLQVQAYRLSVFGTAIPYVTYNFSF
jgi:hypothetical protein